MMKKFLLIACLLGWGTTMLFAQQGSVSAGGTASGAGGTVDFTIGETNYINTTGSGGVITEGLQQPFEITTVGVDELKLQTEVALYPNPTSEAVILSVSGDTKDLSYQLYDLKGALLANSKIEGSETRISLSNYPRAVYFITVINSQNKSKQFKIIKN